MILLNTQIPFLRFAACVTLLGLCASAWGGPAVLNYAEELAREASVEVSYVIDETLGHPEAFRIERGEGGAAAIVAGGPGGVLYGVQELRLPHTVVGAEGMPDFDVRGTVLMMLSASWSYQSELSPERYPWFFDRELMTRYLDYILSARFNTVVIWSGHLFPHILELPEYPDASRFSAEEIRRNQEQFNWFAEEAAKRNISVLTHFYNIHISEDLARAKGREGRDPTRYSEPDDFVREYYHTILLRYLETFPNVSLYICPGESLALEHQEAWFRDVIFRAARDSGRNPHLVIRDWTLDPEFMRKLPDMYENLSSELKHNDETITSTWPDLRHREWAGVLKGHIINLHDPSDATPYRVGSPRMFGEMVRRWHEEGYMTGAWFYPPQCWIWPDTLDIVRDEDGGESTLMTFDRDEMWHLIQGRLLWKAERDSDEEFRWAADWLGRKFGYDRVGAKLVEWYDLTAPILPGLQNLTSIRFGNFFPPSIARVQADVDGILHYRTSIGESPIEGATGLTNQRYYSRPVDEFTLERYKRKHGIDELRDPHSVPVSVYVDRVVDGGDLDGYVLPVELIDLYQEMAIESRARARTASVMPVNDPAEMRRFVQDSEILLLTVDYYRHKILAAMEKRFYERTGDPARLQAFRAHMEASVPAYKRMFQYAEQFYRAGTSMWDAKSWERTLDERVIWDYEQQIHWIENPGDRSPAIWDPTRGND